MNRPPEYAIWYDLCLRCNDPNNKSYENYGGRGLKVDVSFDEFLSDVGPRPPGRTPSGRMSLWRIDRIDNERGYVIGNMRWTDHSTSRINQRIRKLTADQALAIRADPRSLGEIAAAYGISKPHVCSIKKRVFWRHL